MLTHTFAKYVTHSRTFRKRQSAVGAPAGDCAACGRHCCLTATTKRLHIASAMHSLFVRVCGRLGRDDGLGYVFFAGGVVFGCAAGSSGLGLAGGGVFSVVNSVSILRVCAVSSVFSTKV